MTEARFVHLVTTRAEGDLSPAAPNAGADRAAVLAQFGLGLEDLVTMGQVHGARVATVGRADAGRLIPDTDGLVTREPGIALMALGADCPLIALFDPGSPAVAVLHAGWRGLVAGVIEAGLDALAAADPARIRAVVSPHAGACCYEVGEEVAERFPDAVRRRGGRPRPFLDLAAEIERRLGKRPERTGEPCTICGTKSYSYRATKTAERHALIAALGNP